MTKPYYQDDFVTLYHGDCLEVMESLAEPTTHCLCGHERTLHAFSRGDSVCLAVLSAPMEPQVRTCRCESFARAELAQIVVTSPPYNMGLTPGGNGSGMYRTSKTSKGSRFYDGYTDHDDAMPQGEYDQWQGDCLHLMWQVIPDDGAIYYNHKQRIEHGRARLPLGMNFPIPLRQIITWDRGHGIGVSRRHYASVSEFILLFAKPAFTLTHSASGVGDVWRFGVATEKHGHPAPFPVDLPLAAIHGSGARSVLDPFAGSGTTLVAAKQLGVQSIGIEKSERYCEIAANRLAQGVLDFGEAS